MPNEPGQTAKVIENGREMGALDAWNPLRRRPLYPTELRPRGVDGRFQFNNLPAAEAFGADVAAVVHAVEVDGGEGGVGVGDGGGEIGTGGGDAEDAAAGGF